jgi:hypothetical protein
MSAMVDFSYYSNVYQGNEADQTTFPALYAHASRAVGLLTRWQVTEETFPDFDSHIQELVKLAICSQIDFFGINGVDIVNSGDNTGFTVGKVTVHSNSTSGKAGAMSAYISPAAESYLVLTGLMYPGVGVAQC